MWILIDSQDYYTTKTEFEQREIEYINPCLNLFAPYAIEALQPC